MHVLGQTDLLERLPMGDDRDPIARAIIDSADAGLASCLSSRAERASVCRAFPAEP